MPQIDKELIEKGMVPFIPAGVQEAASRRAPDFFTAFMATAVLSKGAFYQTKERFEELKEQFPPIVAAPPASPTPVAPIELSPFDLDVIRFLDLEQENPHPEWTEARELYQKEITEAIDTKCTTCALNSIKRKYKSILSQIPYAP